MKNYRFYIILAFLALVTVLLALVVLRIYPSQQNVSYQDLGGVTSVILENES